MSQDADTFWHFEVSSNLMLFTFSIHCVLQNKTNNNTKMFFMVYRALSKICHKVIHKGSRQQTHHEMSFCFFLVLDETQLGR